MKNTLRYNENLNIEILNMHYLEGFSAKSIYKKIHKKICLRNIQNIISEHKLYKDYILFQNSSWKHLI